MDWRGNDTSFYLCHANEYFTLHYFNTTFISLYRLSPYKEVSTLVVKQAHKCATLEVEASKASRTTELETENAILMKDLKDEHRLKDGVISTVKEVMVKVARFTPR